MIHTLQNAMATSNTSTSKFPLDTFNNGIFLRDANKIVSDCSYSVAASRAPPEFSDLSEWNSFCGESAAAQIVASGTNSDYRRLFSHLELRER
jgi:hypothetical protein